MTAGTQTVMRRKAGAGRRAPSVSPMTAEKALGQAFARAAQELLALPLRVVSVSESKMTLSDLPEALEDRALLAVLDGPAEGMGLMVLSPPVLSALLEMRMMGRMSASPPAANAAARRPTRTDAAISADFIDAALASFEAALVGDPALIWAGGFRYGSFLEDPRPLPLILEDTGYRVFRLVLDLGSGSAAREGGVLLALPAEGRGWIVEAEVPVEEGEAPQPAGWPERLEQAVMSAPAQVEAVLARLTLPIGAILALRPGATLPLAEDTLEQLRIEGPGGRLLARARLGQHRGFRAVRLVEEGEERAPAPGPGGAPAVATMGWGGMDAPTWDDPVGGGETAMPMADMAPMDMGGFGLDALGEGEAGELPPLRMGGM
ncbi:flagellar motor switch protein FliM [Frigidibacter albus]|uniref:Flagellar motor switch protein FliM n=1 Tax=Frigidibacter albus TaxID=1465486 RepID=A0A6L8VD13_9RHOB|nr:FliM/FliN family flagellar motor C-terminal domain-containing protein [Frigidibacter albus]MZQ88104.1 flagellar motor switch protein FliM [Frigidibacter albus]NBE30222.1 flagellar motor switch protein FliM [Frigidibacter albus]GGH47455.1 flagellar switch protein FliM [Frigidibacter albus]